ncbi:MAG TPA: GNAT family N-acetyltransferase [Chloroflexota bacterium]|nr:GNAT family N-acetyltransferase [Chloroflexota bacterium]
MAASSNRQPEPGTIQAFTLGREPVSPLPVARIRFGELASGQETALARTSGISVAEVHRRLADSGSAILALDGDTIAGYGWVQYGRVRIPDLRLAFSLPKHQVYIWDCVTLPAYRGHGIFPGLLRYLLELLRRQGIEQVWAAIAPGNLASQRAFAKAGFRLVAFTDGNIGTFKARPTSEATPEEAALITSSFSA